jgi:superfamily II DNA or RNA helicase
VGSSHQTAPPDGITVVTGRHEFDALVSRNIPVLLVPRREDADILVSRWGLLPHDRYVQTEVYHVASSPEVALIEAFPPLHGFLTEEQQGLQLLRCSVLRLEMLTDKGKTAEDTRFHIEGQTVYYQEDMNTNELIDQLVLEFGLTIGPAEREAILEHRDEQEKRKKIVAVRSMPTIEGRLLAAVGPQSVRRRLSENLIDAVVDMYGQPSDELLARIALSVYGVDALRVFRFELEQNALQPPVQWNGGRNARTFVRNLGFPREFAGFHRADRDPLWEVDGPPNLPPLHDFQKSIVERTRRLIRRETKSRGLLALPTGAGKTRILVEALIEAFREGDLRGPILWIAQTDELCEQAVQTWAYVWRGVGPEGRLGISRLWAGNEAEPLELGIHVVVATIAKLGGCVEDLGYDWLSHATCVVIDEAHGSTEPSYTGVLDWLGLGRGRQRCPLIGLTATPFRGISEEETRRLVRRYGEYRLDADVFNGDPYLELQRMGVLARIQHRLLEGAVVELSENELEQLDQLHRLPSSVEERLGADKNRNRVLLDSIKGLPQDYTVLLFAASVDHAETMAALLSLEGISSATISAATEPGPRRHYGFDAPAVKAIYVARPTFSPNLYQQMIGRGLRGPLNGGKTECLIVNVADNVRRYGGKLAFEHFEYLWNGS